MGEQKYLIFTDISADVDADFVKEHDIRYVPMEYVLGKETHLCDRPATDEEMRFFYEQLRNKVLTQTSQITPNHYMELFEPLLKEGKDIMYLSLSSGLSNTYESALLAAKNLKEDFPDAQIEIVDTLGATGGMGILIEAAAENRTAGMEIAKNAAWLREHACNVNFWFKVQDLMYLKRGGRVSAATAVVGTALNIKPILCINAEGKLDTIDKKRGTKLAIKALLDYFDANYEASLGNLVYICCADCMEEANDLKEQLLKSHPELTIRITMLSPIIGAHTGPEMLSVIHWGKKRGA